MSPLPVDHLAISINNSGATVDGLDGSHPFRTVDHVVGVAGGARNLPAHEGTQSLPSGASKV